MDVIATLDLFQERGNLYSKYKGGSLPLGEACSLRLPPRASRLFPTHLKKKSFSDTNFNVDLGSKEKRFIMSFCALVILITAVCFCSTGDTGK